MKTGKKNIFPKINKKIKGFLTDESGKITKKDALGLAAGSIILGGFDGVDAAGGGSGHSSYGHTNTFACSGGTHNNTFPSHASGIINGHFSSNGGSTSSSVSSKVQSGESSAYGHSSHGSHGSHASDSGDDSGDN